MSAQSNPQPVLMRVQRDAVLPDNTRYHVYVPPSPGQA